jgi:arylsulfatase A-like enzyme
MRPVPRGTPVLAGMIAGLVIGLVDGTWAAIAVGTEARGAVAAALLVAGVDGLLGASAGVVVELIARLALWGRRVRPTGLALAGAAVAVGLAATATTIVVAIATTERRNRFLAAGVVATAAFVAGVVGAALLAPLARLLSRRGRARGPTGGLDPGFMLLGPWTAISVGVVIMAAAIDLRSPFSWHRGTRTLIVVGIEAGLLPGLLFWAERLPLRMKAMVAAPAAIVLFGGSLLMFVIRYWSNHLRFIPWTHVGPAIAIVALAISALVAGARALNVRSPWRRVAVLCAGAAAMVLVTLATSESEIARKVTSAHAGLVGPVLAAARRALDRDHDGYPRLLGGGDCDDRDPNIHPGVLDFPDDGVDQDCDGKDASFALLTPGPFAPVPDTVPSDLNLLLITIDTVRADHLGCYGYGRKTSPQIDRLAAEGGLFLNGWAHAPSTRYSMPAIATGRWPSAITWDESIWWPRIAPGVPTLAEALKARGYFTAAFYSYDYFSPAEARGFERGVDEYRADRAVLHRAVNGPMESRGSSSREMADDAIAFFDTHREQKFFLWVHFYDPHLSYEPHGEVPSFGASRMDLYDGEIRFTDLHVGRVLDRLRALDLWKRTAIVVTGDHGEGFGEHGVTEHGFDLYAPQTKVPFIVRVPGLAARRITTPAGHIDLAPTLMNLARGSRPATFLGRSLVGDLSADPSSSPASSSGGTSRVTVFQEVTSERGKKRGLVTEDLHLIWNWTPDNTTECYDRSQDPDERRDIWGRSNDAACRVLKADLQGMVSALSVPQDVAQKLNASVFAPGDPVPAPTMPLEATIGDVVGVSGYALTPPEVTVSAREVELAIWFTCKNPISGGWRFFFHVMGPGGSFRNLDHIPVDGAMPPERWRPGQRVVDRVRIPFPPGAPRGTYQVIIGLFRGGDRLPITPASSSDGKNALRIAAIVVP